jgi:hypothetical protein
MVPFFEYLQSNRWAIQIIQHTLSLHSHVSMRLLERKLIFENLPRHDNWYPEASLKNGSFLETLPNHIVNYFNNRNNSPWITRASNLHPLIRHLRRDKHWLAWEHYCLGNWLKALKEGGVSTFDYYHSNMKIAACPIHLDEYCDIFLVVGPSFMPPGDGSGQTFSRTCVSPFVDKVLTAFSRTQQSNQYDRDELMLLGTTRGWIGRSRLINKTETLGRVIEAEFTKMHIELSGTDSFSRQAARCN